MTYQKIQDASSLPPEGPLTCRTREKADLDFKRFADQSKTWEHAKDIAAFANASGGVVLVGADNETDPTVLKYPGIRGQNVADVVRIYEQAAKSCSPPLSPDCVPINYGAGVDLVAVNVDPYVDQIVACPGGHRDVGILSSLWRFPIRRGSQTDDIQPEEISMFMNQKTRRAYLMLAAIPSDKRSRVKVWYPQINSPVRGVKDSTSNEYRLDQVPSGRNFLEIGKTGHVSCRIPLGDVLDVWEEDNEVWAIKLSGIIREYSSGTCPHLAYRPLF